MATRHKEQVQLQFVYSSYTHHIFRHPLHASLSFFFSYKPLIITTTSFFSYLMTNWIKQTDHIMDRAFSFTCVQTMHFPLLIFVSSSFFCCCYFCFCWRTRNIHILWVLLIAFQFGCNITFVSIHSHSFIHSFTQKKK